MVVINTCVVRQTAEDTTTGFLGKLKKIKQGKPNMMIVVMGCMVGPKTNELEKRFPHVDIWAAPQKFQKILDPVSEIISKNRLVSNEMRKEIREYSLNFDWEHVVKNIYIPTAESIVGE